MRKGDRALAGRPRLGKRKMEQFHCELCNVNISGEGNYKLHVAGKQHQRRRKSNIENVDYTEKLEEIVKCKGIEKEKKKFSEQIKEMIECHDMEMKLKYEGKINKLKAEINELKMKLL